MKEFPSELEVAQRSLHQAEEAARHLGLRISHPDLPNDIEAMHCLTRQYWELVKITVEARTNPNNPVFSK